MHITLRKPKNIIRENNFGHKPTQLAIKPLRKLCFSACEAAPLVDARLRFSIWSWTPARRALNLYYKVAIFQPELENCTSCTRLYTAAILYAAAIVQLELKTSTLRTRLVLQSCDF